MLSSNFGLQSSFEMRKDRNDDRRKFVGFFNVVFNQFFGNSKTLNEAKSVFLPPPNKDTAIQLATNHSFGFHEVF